MTERLMRSIGFNYYNIFFLYDNTFPKIIIPRQLTIENRLDYILAVITGYKRWGRVLLDPSFVIFQVCYKFFDKYYEKQFFSNEKVMYKIFEWGTCIYRSYRFKTNRSNLESI